MDSFHCGNDKREINPVWETIKWLFGASDHTLPALALGLVEKIPKTVSPETVKGFIQEGLALKAELQEILGEKGILLFPSHAKVAPFHHQPLLTPFNFAYTAIFNVLEMPSAQCPLGLGAQGLPLGIQVVSSHGNDHLPVAVALALQRRFGGWHPPPL